jgi:ABC-2 type transport system ATP-binding protein
MLEVRGLTKRYTGTLAVDHVSFQISPGEILGYVGPNGAGKSTTVKMILGLLDPSEGMVLFEGRSVREDLAGFQSRIGYVPEEPYLYPYLSGYEYLELTGRLRGMDAAAIETKSSEFLRLFGLWDDRHTPVSSYSKGMRQKILLSAALLGNPQLLLFDEPLSGLDVTSMLVVRELMQGLAAQGRIILYSSHVLEVVEKVCSRVLILNKGRVAAHDSIQHLRETTRQSSLQAIFSDLTRETDPAVVAGRFLEVMAS